MHKRLVSNRWDGLNDYDIAYPAEYSMLSLGSDTFSDQQFPLVEPASNYAKSGTTDDILRPFNVDPTSNKKTNYGLWNAVIRVDLSALSEEQVPEIRDLTIACIGECNYQYTGARDGKSLHKFLSTGLLKKAGITSPNGFFSQYESYLRRTAPDSVRNCGKREPVLTAEEMERG
jgi:hypothetical protein